MKNPIFWLLRNKIALTTWNYTTWTTIQRPVREPIARTRLMSELRQTFSSLRAPLVILLTFSFVFFPSSYATFLLICFFSRSIIAFLFLLSEQVRELVLALGQCEREGEWTGNRILIVFPLSSSKLFTSVSNCWTAYIIFLPLSRDCTCFFLHFVVVSSFVLLLLLLLFLMIFFPFSFLFSPLFFYKSFLCIMIFISQRFLRFMLFLGRKAQKQNDKGSVKKVFFDHGHIEKCGLMHGVQQVPNNTFQVFWLKAL